MKLLSQLYCIKKKKIAFHSDSLAHFVQYVAAVVTIDNCAVCCYAEKQLVNCIAIRTKLVLINTKCNFMTGKNCLRPNFPVQLSLAGVDIIIFFLHPAHCLL